MQTLLSIIVTLAAFTGEDAYKAFQTGFTALMSIVLFRLNAGQRRMERAEDARNDAMRELAQKVELKDQQLHELAEKLVDTKFRNFAHSIDNHVNGFKLALDEAKLRLADTEGDLGKLVEAAHAKELAARDKLDQVKDYVRDHAASKTDMKEHQRQVNEQFSKLDAKLDRIASATGAKRNA